MESMNEAQLTSVLVFFFDCVGHYTLGDKPTLDHVRKNTQLNLKSILGPFVFLLEDWRSANKKV